MNCCLANLKASRTSILAIFVILVILAIFVVFVIGVEPLPCEKEDPIEATVADGVVGAKGDNSDHSAAHDVGLGGLNWAGVRSEVVLGMDTNVADMDEVGCRNGGCVCADVLRILL